MPLYEYACQKCEHQFEIRHSANDTPALTCPKCGGAVRKVFHATGIIFKGSGWHITDYGPKKHVPAEEKESKPAEESASKPAEENASKPVEEKKDSTPAATAK
ncbi:MAG: FmdB family zinc ribbon protein [Armatimonadota bacterium]